MPRPNDIASLGNIGPGSIPKGAVEDISLRNPERDTLPLIAHVQDPSRAHMAASTGIVDAGGYYASDEVEGALQEIGGATSEGRQNGVVTGFGYTDVGLVVTFDTPSQALVPGLKDFSGETLTLPDNTPSVWAYVDASTGNLALSVGLNPPSVTSPENLLLWQFATAAGAIGAARDARLYVRNLDRKLPFTVRSSGSVDDQESEACFVSLEAALVYLQYSVSLGSLRTEVIIRGPVTSGPIDLPVDGIQFRGEDGASVTLTTGAYLFDLLGRSGTTFSGLTFQTNVAGATAIVDSVGATPTDSPTLVESCIFTGGLSSWDLGIDLAFIGKLAVSSCKLTVTTTGISVADPFGVLVENTEVSAINFLAGSLGIRIGNLPVTTPNSASTVTGCTVTGFDLGISLVGEAPVVTGCKVFPGNNATAGIIVGPSTNVVVSGNFVDCDQNASQVGLRADASSADITGLKVIGNTFFGARTYGIDFQGSVQESVVQGNTIDCNIPSSPNDPTALAGIYIHLAGAPVRVPSYLTVSGNVVWRACTGIYVEGSATNFTRDILVEGNTVHHCAVGVGGAPVGLFQVSTGIGAAYCAGLNVAANDVYGIGFILLDNGVTVQPTPANVHSLGVYFQACELSLVSGNQVRDLGVKGAGKSSGVFHDNPGSFLVGGRGVRVCGNGLSNIPGEAILFAIGSSAAVVSSTLDGALVSGNTANQVQVGIRVVANGLGDVRDLRVEGNTVDTTTSGFGIELAALDAPGVFDGVLQGVQVTGNSVTNTFAAGISLSCADNATVSGVSLDRNQVRLPQAEGILVGAGTLGGSGPALFRGVSVSDNDITMTPATVQAISVTLLTPLASDLRLDDNTILSAYDGIQFGASGVAGGNCSLNNFSISGNRVQASNRGFYGIVGGFVDRLSVLDNNIVAGDTVFSLAVSSGVPTTNSSDGLTLSRNRFLSNPAGVNTVFTFSNQKVSGILVEDNNFAGGLGSSIGGVYFLITGAGFMGASSIRDLAVRRNIFRDMDCAGLAIAVPGPVDDAVNFDLSGNMFDNVATDGAVARSSVVICNIDAVVRNMAIRDNHAVSFGHGATTHGGLDLTLRGTKGLDISGNMFDSAPLGPSYGSIIHIEGQVGAADLQDVSVCRNKSRGVEVPAVGSRLSLISLDVQNFTATENLSVCDNDLDRVNNGPGNTNGIRLQTTNVFERFACDRNRVTGVVSSSSAALNLLVGASGVTDASVSGNHITGDSANGASGPGIQLNLSGNGFSTRVCDNTVIGKPAVPAKGGIGIVGLQLADLRVEGNSVAAYQNPIEIQCTNLSRLSFLNNTATNFTVDNFLGGDAGFRLDVTNTSESLALSGNKCQSSASNARGWNIALGDSVGDLCYSLIFANNQVTMSGAASTSPLRIRTQGAAFERFAFSGNVFLGPSTNGIAYVNGGGTPPNICTFMGNIGDGNANSWSQFEVGGGATWTSVLPPAGAGAGQFQTFNVD